MRTRRGARLARTQARINERSWTIYYLGKKGRRRARFSDRDAARDRARELTTRDDVAWVTVFPPESVDMPTCRWSRARGWRTGD